ncbi:MAG: hypothetical protein KUG77_18380 [Nannocystaceae bacterium]|nr:hypothetical protein [Nannocystaceae bacterium]
MVRSVLGVATLAVLAGCPIPSTLGLPCEDHVHCDDAQFCVEGTCRRMPPTGPMGTTGPVVPPTTTAPTGDPSSTATTDPTATSPTESSSSTGGPETTSSSTGPSCGVDSCTDLDVLLVIDTSESMSQWLVPLSNSLPNLFSLFDDELSDVCSFHLGLASADRMPVGNTTDCQYPGALVQRPSNCSTEGAPPYYSTELDGEVSTAFSALQCTILSAGFNGSDDEHMLEALLGALNPENNARGECNDGFRRPGANLAIVYVSDENDPTPSEEQDTVAELFQDYLDPGLVAFISVVADPVNVAPECVWDPEGDEEGTGAETPSALNGFLALSGIPLAHQARVDICETVAYEFDDAFGVFTSICEG